MLAFGFRGRFLRKNHGGKLGSSQVVWVAVTLRRGGRCRDARFGGGGGS